MLKLGDEIIMEGILFSKSPEQNSRPLCHIEADDPEKIKRWCKLLGTLLKIPENRVEIDLTK